MNLRILALAFLVGSPAVLIASQAAPAAEAAVQQPGPPPLETLIRPLNLSAAQQQKLAPLVSEARARVREDLAEARRNDERLDSAEFMARVRTREADLREKVQPLLSAQQLARYDAMSEERTPQRSPAAPVHGHHEMDTPQTALER